MYNIPKNIVDPFYRYKREKIKYKLLGKGNGKYTVIENLSKISKQIDRKEEYIIKWFSYDLNSQITKQSDNYIIKGHFNDDLENSLEKFIKDFILCKICSNPETILLTNKNIFLKCKGCGNIKETKSKNKLTEFLLKDKSIKDKSIDINEKNINNINVKKIENFDKLKNFVLNNSPSYELKEIRDELRLNPEELVEKISLFLIENNVFVKLKNSWSSYFNDIKRSSILLNTIFKTDQSLLYLKNFYNLDYLREEDIFIWYNSLSSETDFGMKTKIAAIPFITWLENAEEESSE